jgi:hypothetical protein
VPGNWYSRCVTGWLFLIAGLLGLIANLHGKS